MDVPEIRIKGFDGEWSRILLSDHADFSKGTGYTKSDLRPSGEQILLYGSLYTNYKTAISTVETFVTPKPNSVYSRGDEVVVPASGESSEDIVRASAVVSKGLILGSDLNIIRPDREIDQLFLALTISNGQQNQLVKRAQGNTIVHLRNSDLHELEFSLPTLGEQRAIGSFFDNFDTAMQRQTTRLMQLRNLKQTMLAKMFPHAGETAPEIRFAGFSGEWSEIKLGDLGVARAGTGFPDKEQAGLVGVPFYKVSDMNTPKNTSKMITANNYVTEQQIQRNAWTVISDVPAIIFAKVGAAVFVGRKRLAEKPFLIDNNMMSYSINGDAWDVDFARTTFDQLDLTRLVQVGALPSFNPPAVSALSILLPPTLDEQRAIGNYFSRFAQLIELEQSKLTKLQQLKTTLLDKMFV